MNTAARIDRIEAALADRVTAVACESCGYPRSLALSSPSYLVLPCDCGRWLTPDGRPLADGATFENGAAVPLPLTDEEKADVNVIVERIEVKLGEVAS